MPAEPIQFQIYFKNYMKFDKLPKRVGFVILLFQMNDSIKILNYRK